MGGAKCEFAESQKSDSQSRLRVCMEAGENKWEKQSGVRIFTSTLALEFLYAQARINPS